MAAAYSMDLRTRVLRDSDAGLSSKQLAERYHVSRAWVDALKQRRRETGSIAARKQTKFRGRVRAGAAAAGAPVLGAAQLLRDAAQLGEHAAVDGARARHFRRERAALPGG